MKLTLDPQYVTIVRDTATGEVIAYLYDDEPEP